MMHRSEFQLQARGPRRFDTWRWAGFVQTNLGALPLELYTSIGEAPSEGMIEVASRLVEYCEGHGAFLRNLIVGHYRYAQEKGWLEFWNVRSGLAEPEIVGEVLSITLSVHDDLDAGVHIDPKWDPEHKLSLTFDGEITRVNGEPFVLDGAVLRPQ